MTSANFVSTSAFLVLLALVVLFTGHPAKALSGQANETLSWYVSGDANPYLLYEFESLHSVTYSDYNAAEAIAPVSLVGQMKRDSVQFEHCLKLGFVNSAQLSCKIDRFGFSCPLVSGQWKAFTRATAFVPPLGKVHTAVSGPVTASCPPPTPNCNLGAASNTTRFISLQTGLALDQLVGADVPSMQLHRRGVDSHGEYLKEEWAVMEISEGRIGRVEQASSPDYEKHLSSLQKASPRSATGLSSTSGLPLPTSGRYLVVQGSGHAYSLTPPLVKYANGQPSIRGATAGRQLLVLRATFDAAGQLQAIDTLHGPAEHAVELASSLELVFPERSEHRGALFAVFEIGGNSQQATLLAAVPMLFNCC